MWLVATLLDNAVTDNRYATPSFFMTKKRANAINIVLYLQINMAFELGHFTIQVTFKS